MQYLSKLRPWSLGLALAILGAEASATQFSANVNATNRSGKTRTEWVVATVPFNQGVYFPGQTFSTLNVPGEIEPFGALWTDGSVRYGRLTAQATLGAGQKVSLAVGQGGMAPPAFTFSPWVSAGRPNFGSSLIVGTPGGAFTATLGTPVVLESTNARLTEFYRARIPQTDLLYELWVTTFSDQDNAKFELRVTNSNPSSPSAWQFDIDYLGWLVQGAYPLVRGSVREGLVQSTPTFSGTNAVVLMQGAPGAPTHLYDGQAREWFGDLLFFDESDPNPDPARVDSLLATLNSPLWGVADNWSSSGAFGPFGVTPPAPPWLNSQAALTAEAQNIANAFDTYIATPAADPFEDRPRGLAQYAGQTGDQEDFGMCKLHEIFVSADSDPIFDARYNAGEEAMRPVHFYEANATPVLSANHPDWVSLSGRTHWSTSVSPDRLGKVAPEPPLNAHAWTGKDSQHWSSLNLASAYLLTTSFSLQRELENEAELYIAGHTLPSQKPGWSTNGIDTPRAVGRTSLSMSWNYLCTGNLALLQRLSQRITQNITQQYAGQPPAVTGPVRPMSIAAPDPRVLLVPYWRTWEEAQASMGLEAAHLVTLNPLARQWAIEGGRTVLNYGWLLNSSTTIIATGVAWKPGGVPLTAAEYQDPNLVLWSFGTGFSEWSLTATQLGMVYGTLLGDPALTAQATNIVTRLRALRQMPPGGGWDRFAGWDLGL